MKFKQTCYSLLRQSTRIPVFYTQACLAVHVNNDKKFHGSFPIDTRSVPTPGFIDSSRVDKSLIDL